MSSRKSFVKTEMAAAVSHKSVLSRPPASELLAADRGDQSLDFAIATSLLRSLTEQISNDLRSYHASQPLRPGLAREEARRRLGISLADIDAAIGEVSSRRADLGASQNRLEHRLNNLATYQENLVASESRIRDVDMAQEMVNFSKLQILQQAGTAMLAQANQSSQGVLSLLR